MIRAILRKDFTLLWPLVALVAAIQLALEWGFYKSAFFGVNPVAGEIINLLTIPWFLGVIALSVVAIHEDPIPGADQDWLVRPLPRTRLLLAKTLFALVAVCAPMLVFNIGDELALGFPLLPSVADAVYKELYLFACLILPAMAVASVTRSLTELVVFMAALVVLYALSLSLSGFVFGSDRCPTCDTGESWLQHLLMHVIVLAGSVWILFLQFYRRATTASRVIAAAGVVVLVFAQLPWGLAFSLQSAMESPGVQPPVSVTAAVPAVASARPKGPRGPSITRRTTQALLHGNVDAAVENLKRFRMADEIPVTLSLPVVLSGLSENEFVVADRVEFSVLDEHGRRIYRGTNASRIPVALKPDTAGAPVTQAVEIPETVYRRAAAGRLTLSVDYSLTRMRMSAEIEIEALDGAVRSPHLGLCQSRPADENIRVVCRRIGWAPNCYAATLYADDGTHNPEVLLCRWDYRPYIPAPQAIMSLNAITVPVQDPAGLGHYPVDPGDLPNSYIVLKAYEPVDHYRRTVRVSLPPAD